MLLAMIGTEQIRAVPRLTFGIPDLMQGVGLVPALITDNGESLGQSLAIIDWLDRHFPQTPLLPANDPQRFQELRKRLRTYFA